MRVASANLLLQVLGATEVPSAFATVAVAVWVAVSLADYGSAP